LRSAFFRTLLDIAATNDRIHLVTGDIGYGVVEPFSQRYSERFLNVGVAEQNMTGIAVGMALSGKIVFTYSIGNFPTIRCLEQIRNDVCYHQANVKIVTVGGGFSYGALGTTHHATEDLSIMRALPGMIVIAPGDPIEATWATKAIVNQEGPCYLRLGRAGEKNIHTSQNLSFKIGRAISVREGNDLTLISTGGMLSEVVTVSDRLAARGLKARVLSMHTLKPLDEMAIRQAAEETSAIFTVEEHSVIGGLGSAVAEVLMEMGTNKIVFKRIGVPDTFAKEVGDQNYLREKYGLGIRGILNTVESSLSLIS